jgi:uncharacterized protein (DUF362 family)
MENTDVIIAKGIDHASTFLNGVKLLGGFKAVIDKDDIIFIKITLNDIQGFPSHSDVKILQLMVKECKEAGAKQIYIGSIPREGLETHEVEKILRLDEILKISGAEFSFLDDQNSCSKINLEASNEIIKIPDILLKCDKFIIFNQINVHPLFQFSLAIQNAYSLIIPKYRKVKVSKSQQNSEHKDQYRDDLITKILDVNQIRKPDLVINDIFQVLEQAGPYIYRDSNLKTTNLMIFGKEPITVDFATLKIFDLDPYSNELLSFAIKREQNEVNISDLNFIGESIEQNRFQIKPCTKNLEQLDVYGTEIKTGTMCSGCYEQAYHLINFMKTFMTKDLVYIMKQTLLIGETPKEPENHKNVLLFGDCAINSTRKYDFRKLIITKKTPKIFETLKKVFKKKTDKSATPRIIKKKNKDILELPGCPPTIKELNSTLINYYSKKNAPNLHFYMKSLEILKKNLKKRETK